MSAILIECIQSNAITLSIAIYLIIIVYYKTKYPDELFENIYLYLFFTIVPLIIGVIYTLKKSTQSIVNMRNYIKSLIRRSFPKLFRKITSTG